MNALRWYSLAPSPLAGSPFAHLLRGSLALGLVLGTGCDINVNDGGGGDSGAETDGGDDDDDGDDGSNDGSNDGNNDGSNDSDNDGSNDGDNDGSNDGDPDGTGDGSDNDDDTDPTDDDADPTDDNDDDQPGAEGDPEPGSWLYTETGETTNSCTFLEEVSNGFGDYQVVATGAGTWQIIPGDDTDPFECETAGAGFACAERLQDEISQGLSSIQVLVSIDGQLNSSTEMEGVQHGVADCEGPDCALAEQLLATSFPCDFDIPFTGTRL